MMFKTVWNIINYRIQSSSTPYAHCFSHFN